jgi:cellulose synthase/poly-beta-1,6-N-acetylglucosamine synthase-like glycosyltransferase
MLPIIYGLAPIHLPTFFYLDLIARGGVVPKGRYRNEGVTIIIPCHNEEAVIANTLRKILGLRDLRKEVIVVDDASTDRTFEAASSFKDVKVIRKTSGGRGKAEAINVAVKEAKYDLICIFDADSRPFKRSIQYLVPYLRAEKVAAACGVIKVRNRNYNWLTKLVALEYTIANYLQCKKSMINSYVPWMPGTITLIKRRFAKFPDSYVEDAELSAQLMKKGYRVMVDKRAKASEIAPVTLRDYLRQRVRWARGGWALLKYVDKNRPLNYLLTFFERVQPGLTIASWFVFAYSVYRQWFLLDFILTPLWALTTFTLMWLYRVASNETGEKTDKKTYLTYFFFSSFLYLLVWLRSLFPIRGWHKTMRRRDFR